MLIKKAILLGQADDRTDYPLKRLKTMLLIAFGQKKMFNRPIVGLLHFIVYAGFIIINIEVLEILLDGLLGTHRIFAKPLGGLYPVLINCFEVLALGVLLACAIFLFRRNVLKVSRFQEKDYREMTRWPRLDANIILTAEILLMFAFLSMNATDTILQARGVEHFGETLTGSFTISQFLHPLFNHWSDFSLELYERFAWWFHILGILAFVIYVTYSKHLHIFWHSRILIFRT